LLGFLDSGESLLDGVCPKVCSKSEPQATKPEDERGGRYRWSKLLAARNNGRQR
jgi:hypothetical protein